MVVVHFLDVRFTAPVSAPPWPLTSVDFVGPFDRIHHPSWIDDLGAASPLIIQIDALSFRPIRTTRKSDTMKFAKSVILALAATAFQANAFAPARKCALPDSLLRRRAGSVA